MTRRQSPPARNTTAVSRRTTIAALSRGAVLLVVGPVIGCGRPAASQVADGDDALLARLLAGPRPHIPRRAAPYRIAQPLLIAAGITVTIEPGTRIIWAGRTDDNIVGVFEATGDNTAIVVANGGEAFIECEVPSPAVYAALMRGQHGFSVTGLFARNCGHVCIQGGSSDYRAIRTAGAGANVARDVRISGGGASFAAPQTRGQGACLLAYVAGAHVADVRYENVPHGIQWWGGDAGTEPWQNGARGNERKCTNVAIERATVRNAHVGGIWGSMGRAVTVRDCAIDECGDVGFDAEGCVDVVFERCRARNGHNGCFATFSLCDGIRFVDCRGSVDRKSYPLFRIYNATQSNADNRSIQITGGRFECLDRTGPGTMDSAMGPAQDVAITGATLDNVRIDLAFFNMHRTRIAGNLLTFPYLLPAVAAIRAGASKSITGAATASAGGAEVEGNTIRYTAAGSRTAAIAIQLREDDFNSNAAGTVAENVVTGPFAIGVSVVNATANVGIVPAFNIRGNRFNGLVPDARLLAVAQEGRQARPPMVRWDATQTRDGQAQSLATATGRTYSN